MTTKAILKLGRINANEDEAKLVEVAINNGEYFKKGDVIIVLETTKAAVEVIAPSDGRMIALHAEQGTMLAIGGIVFEAEFEGDIVFEMLEKVDLTEQANPNGKPHLIERKVSFKAQMLAKDFGIDPAHIPSCGDIIKESDVRDYACKQGLAVIAAPLAADDKAAASSEVAQLPATAMKAIVFGAGGHAKSILPLINEAGYSVVGVVDTKGAKGSFFLGKYPVLGTDADLKSIRASGIAVAFIGVGGATNNTARSRIFRQLKEANFILPPLVSKMANIDTTSHLGEATYVFPGATVGADCVIGSNVIVNQGSIICHDCNVGDHAHLAPGSILAGAVAIGSGSTIGMAATIMNSVSVGDNVLVHNSVAVSRNIPTGTIVTLKGIIDADKLP